MPLHNVLNVLDFSWDFILFVLLLLFILNELQLHIFLIISFIHIKTYHLILGRYALYIVDNYAL